ncbi:hypothetical protein ACJU26_09000 [Acidithiobacillus sp. M4-SHS-6]|uniref:hypothetical protein n=1 Tax=Acidithiobacillus sp. M4-SHS-6 TaxID=3383024 RepID=UPI0039BEBD00
MENDKRYQPRGIDYFWIRHQENVTRLDSVEVKTDTWDTGNLYLELVANEEREKPGWLYTSEAQWLSYVVLPQSRMYLVPFPELREWYRRSVYTQKSFWKRTFTGNREGGYHSWGVPCPITDILRETTHREVDIGIWLNEELRLA